MKSFIFLSILAFTFIACKTSEKKRGKAIKTEKTLNGNWELNYISLEADLISFEELYAKNKPSVQFNIKNKEVAGNTSCNIFNGAFKIEGNQISFNEAFGMTRMMCEGLGEQKFLEALKQVNTYSISEEGVLALMIGDVAVLRFVRK